MGILKNWCFEHYPAYCLTFSEKVYYDKDDLYTFVVFFFVLVLCVFTNKFPILEHLLIRAIYNTLFDYHLGKFRNPKNIKNYTHNV